MARGKRKPIPLDPDQLFDGPLEEVILRLVRLAASHGNRAHLEVYLEDTSAYEECGQRPDEIYQTLKARLHPQRKGR